VEGERLLNSVNESSVLNRSTFKGGGKMGKRYFSGWNRNGMMMGYILLTMVVYLSLGMMSLPALGVTLDSKGQWSASCRAGYLASHKFDKTTLKNTYTFKGECDESSGGSVTNRWYHVNASWNGSTKTASEDLSVTFSNDHLAGSIIYSCPDDPWINTVNCTITGKAGDIFAYFQPTKYPISANFISSSQKQTLKTEWTSTGAVLATPQAPVIQSPFSNQKFLAPVTVQIKVQHNPNYNVAFEFQRAELVSKPNIPNLWGTEQIVLNNLKVSAGITTGDFSIKQPGKWRVRAQSIFPNAPWSGWTEFVVDTLKRSPELSPAGKPGK
jgi:hypothetical protein